MPRFSLRVLLLVSAVCCGGVSGATLFARWTPASISDTIVTTWTPLTHGSLRGNGFGAGDPIDYPDIWDFSLISPGAPFAVVLPPPHSTRFLVPKARKQDLLFASSKRKTNILSWLWRPRFRPATAMAPSSTSSNLRHWGSAPSTAPRLTRCASTR